MEFIIVLALLVVALGRVPTVLLVVQVALGRVSPADATRRWTSTSQRTFIESVVALTKACGGELGMLRMLLFPLLAPRNGAPSAQQLSEAFAKALRPAITTQPNTQQLPILKALTLIIATAVRVLQGRLTAQEAVAILAAVPQAMYVRIMVFTTLRFAAALDGLEQTVGIQFPKHRPSRDRLSYEFEEAEQSGLTAGSDGEIRGPRKRKHSDDEVARLYRAEQDKGGSG